MKKNGMLASGLLTVFVLWTAAVLLCDVRAIGPEGSAVGFATFNGWVRDAVGVRMGLYVLTDWLGLVPFAVAAGFGVLGCWQWITRKSLWKVDADLFVLGGFYIVVIGVYLFFETVVINHRPVLINGILEASYPSSTTTLVLCVMPTAILQWRARIKNTTLKTALCAVTALFTVFMVVARVLAGVHWITDIIGGVLLGTGLVCAYRFAVDCLRRR